MQTCQPFVATLCGLTRPFVAVFVLQLIALRWGMNLTLTPLLYLQALAVALGIVGGIAWLLHRVNSRAHAAAQLQHTQLLQLQKAIESAPSAIFLTDPEQRVTYVNPAFTELTGYTADEAIGQRPSLIKSGMMPESFYEAMFEAIKRGERFRSRVLNRKKGIAIKTPDNGVEFSPQTHYWAETVIAPIRDESGTTLGFLSIQTDITEQVMREQAAAHRQELNALLSQISLTLQDDAPLSERLPHLLEALRQRGAIGESGTLAFWEREGETLRLCTSVGAFQAHFQSGWQTLVAYEWDYNAPHAMQLSIQGRTVNAIAVPLRWMHQSLGLLLVVCDRCRSDWVGLDEALRDFLSDLGELLAMALLRERSHQALLSAKEAAEELARARSEFLANMSHELRTPMNGVLGMLNLLKDTPLTDEQHDLLQTAETSAQHLLEILNDILHLAKIEAGQMQLERVPTDLCRLMHEACEMVRPQAQLKGIELRAELPNEAIHALADPTRLRQILLNLLSNAIKFTEQGEVVARLVLRNANTPDEHALRFEVQDSGIGIPPEKQQQIFEPFRQADGSTTRKYGGTGLGLAISKKLVELMGGQMGVISQVGVGSTFWIEVSLPVCDAPAPTQQEPLAAAQYQALTGLRVLVAEDNPVNQKVIRRTLEKWGIEVHLANHGGEAVEQLAQEPFHLVLMDCQMPEMDGYEATRRIRAHEQPHGRHTPIIALTANALQGDREKCLECGMNDYLTKPVNPNQLREKLLQWGVPRMQQPEQAA